LARTRLDLPPPSLPLKKQLSTYDHFQTLQYRGIPNRRVIGRQSNLWWGDMECNKRPYIVILAPHEVDLTRIYRHFAAQAGVVCFGNLFHWEQIDYGTHATSHPLYPADAPFLRDLKKPNFLFDIIQAHPGQRVAFSIRVPCHTEMPQLALGDPHCSPFFVVDQKPFYEAKGSRRLLWEHAFDDMVMSDLYWEAAKNGKAPVVIDSSGDRVEQVVDAHPLFTTGSTERPSDMMNAGHGNGQHAEDGRQASSPPDESAAAEHQRTATHLASGLPS
jgi:hypothetical protein